MTHLNLNKFSTKEMEHMTNCFVKLKQIRRINHAPECNVDIQIKVENDRLWYSSLNFKNISISVYNLKQIKKAEVTKL